MTRQRLRTACHAVLIAVSEASNIAAKTRSQTRSRLAAPSAGVDLGHIGGRRAQHITSALAAP